MGRKDAEEQALQARTLDYVATGEQQSEAGHEVKFSTGSTSGSYRGENYRDAKNGEFIQYVVENTQGLKNDLSLMLRFITSDRGRTADIFIDDQKLGDITIQPRMQGADEQGFFNVEYAIPESLLLDSKGNVKKKLTFKIVASPNTMCPGLYYVRLMKK